MLNNKETEFWTAARRQYGVIAIVNMVTFLFGASQPTASISLPRLPLLNDSNVANGTTWPRDFAVTSEEGEWISKCRRLIYTHYGLHGTSHKGRHKKFCDTLVCLFVPMSVYVFKMR